MTLFDDERTFCAEPGCDHPEVGLLRITRDLLMLGHRREPKTLHSAPALEGPPRRARDEARSEPGLSDLASAVPGATLREHA